MKVFGIITGSVNGTVIVSDKQRNAHTKRETETFELNVFLNLVQAG